MTTTTKQSSYLTGAVAGALLFQGTRCMACGREFSNHPLARTAHAKPHIEGGDAVPGAWGSLTKAELTAQGAAMALLSSIGEAFPTKDYVLRQWAFGSFIIGNAINERYAWSGSRWVAADLSDGVQVCNFDTEREADGYAAAAGLRKMPTGMD